ncbi:hypothetical protein [Pararhizobium haloflavum]|nr:hypothetical protein [Pararhizobium haloflavum]
MVRGKAAMLGAEETLNGKAGLLTAAPGGTMVSRRFAYAAFRERAWP